MTIFRKIVSIILIYIIINSPNLLVASSISKFNFAFKRMECRSTQHDTIEISWVPYISLGNFFALMATINFNTVATTTKGNVYETSVKFLPSIFIPSVVNFALRLSAGIGYQKWFKVTENNTVYSGEMGLWFGEKSTFNEIFFSYTTTRGRNADDLVEYNIGIGLNF